MNSSINTKLRIGEIPKYEKVLAEGHDVIPVCLIGDPAYHLLPFFMKEYPGRGKKQREKYFGYKLSSGRIAIENAFGKLKP